ncbi:Holliday junction resolvase RecU [Parageobacillus thermoglucosidasius]|uniref:Holliday junction resolvase RecU n=1 Tax=Parageobacillus thermoglucosidasius TaxID=1426 RepID=UPI002E1C580B|nr:Holliday junction resolvase RecU [Parageobacillus thermoglucosidasius]MED4914349.1 Holliday junction resolvase RecU [Parageobacillus thermoglucosidasius]MED4946473.1 Holliday junction resolvase RecU [Parageobacillus thermoglucosidasius]MED4984034.1 Holliday junction resolvase RecU [Parageobacillus thermoglucosidasius]
MYISKANRGMGLENYINTANTTYKLKRIALVDKRPVPIKFLTDENGHIRKAWFDQKSTVDYYGVFDGVPIAFECKSTREKTRFPLSMIEKHQYEYLREFHMQKGISFVIIEFAVHHEIYILKFEQLQKWWLVSLGGGRKSIPYSWIKENCERCKPGLGLSVDYLAAVRLCYEEHWQS